MAVRREAPSIGATMIGRWACKTRPNMPRSASAHTRSVATRVTTGVLRADALRHMMGTGRT